MKQLLQNMSSGETYLAEVPVPQPRRGQLLIATTTSLISVGTERMLIDFGRASLLQKARKQPERVKMVLDKARTDGIGPTLEAVRSKLDQPIPLGYCNVGVIKAVGQDCEGFSVGDRVISNGSHAEVVCVPKNLCARIPDNVTDQAAAFTVISAIGLQGTRLATPTLGEAFVVIGAGLIGLLTIQILIAQGCRVLAIDFDAKKLELAKLFGAEICNPSLGEDPVAAGMAFSRGRGVDGVLITASTQSPDPVTHAARMSRKRGRIILVGVTGLELNRADFYEKELSFQVSCSYGPGRYDPIYENGGNDYPFAFVRWTEQRNFEAVLDMLSSGRLDISPLVSGEFEFESAPQAYEQLLRDKSALGMLFTYPAAAEKTLSHAPVQLNPQAGGYDQSRAVCGLIGAGNYASRVLVPALKQTNALLHTVVSAAGTSGAIVGKKHGFDFAASSVSGVLGNPDINTVVVATRHDTHARFVGDALKAGKNVFVEKPLALTLDEVTAVENDYKAALEKGAKPRLMVGFNRRFAPHIIKAKSLLASLREPKTFIMTMNAGAIPAAHWTQDSAVGGGRIIGEACHYIDLMRFLADAPITYVSARRMGEAAGVEILEDKAVLVLGFGDGSFGTINYLANGNKSFPKERIEVFCSGRVLQVDNFRKLTGFGFKGFSKISSWTQDKGQRACMTAFITAIEQGLPSPISADEIFEVAKVNIKAAQILRDQK